jgi:transglutaminase-like putative cysteine protease
VTGTLAIRYSVPNLSVAEWALISPYTPSLSSQSDVATAISVVGDGTQSEQAYEVSLLSRPMSRLHIVGSGALGHAADARYTYAVTLWRRDLVAGTPLTPVPALSASERAMFLLALSTINHDDAGFRSWLSENGLLRAGGERDLGYAYRVFRFIVTHFEYGLSSEDRRPSAVCRLGRSDCGGLSMLFTAAMRANGVPARTLWGRWAVSQADPNYGQWHVTAEVFGEGVGWVYVDTANSVGKPEAQTYFGRGEGNFITFHLDTDLTYDSLLFGLKDAVWMQSPHWWVKGTGGWDGWGVVENWTVAEDAAYHPLAITDGPAALPNPVASGGVARPAVAVYDTVGHVLAYNWTARDAVGNLVGGFDDPAKASPAWTAPANQTDDPARCTLEVTVACDHGGQARGSCLDYVLPVADAVQITDGPTADPNPVASACTVHLAVVASDSRNHKLSYQWTAKASDGTSAGSFDAATAQAPIWTAPANRTGATAKYTVSVAAKCEHGAQPAQPGLVEVGVLPVGDLDRSGLVDSLDLAAFCAAWRQARAGTEGWDRAADLDGDGHLNAADARQMIEVFAARGAG